MEHYDLYQEGYIWLYIVSNLTVLGLNIFDLLYIEGLVVLPQRALKV